MKLFGWLPLMANINMESSRKTHATGILNHWMRNDKTFSFSYKLRNLAGCLSYSHRQSDSSIVSHLGGWMVWYRQYKAVHKFAAPANMQRKLPKPHDSSITHTHSILGKLQMELGCFFYRQLGAGAFCCGGGLAGRCSSLVVLVNAFRLLIKDNIKNSFGLATFRSNHQTCTRKKWSIYIRSKF